MKVLNLYAGIGGNRKLWKNVEVTAVEQNPKIAKIYKDFFPMDKMVVGEAHDYLQNNFKDFDFIWSSPPCPSHSDIRRLGVDLGQNKAIFPDMKLYEEIIFLKHFFKGDWVVENVRSYYDPLIKPYLVDRHYFWSNNVITDKRFNGLVIEKSSIGDFQNKLGFCLDKYDGVNKKTLLRNCVNPELALHVFNCCFKDKQRRLI